MTGKEIHEMYAPSCRKPLAWDDLAEQAQKAYNDVAEKITAKHITPMQTLLMDIRNFMMFDKPWRRKYQKEWEAERDTLFLRAREMLK